MLAGSRLKAIITGNDKPAVFFDKAPEEKVYTSSVGGESPSITTCAVAIGLEGKVTYKYQWYVTSNHENPTDGAVAVKGATSTTLKAPVTERGGKYYYCEVTVTCNGKTYTATSDIYCVVVAAKGKKAVTTTILIGNTASGDEEAGWKYTPKNGDSPARLELDDFEGFIPFAINSDSYRIFVYSYDKLEVVLKEGSVNNVGDCSSTFWIYTSSPIAISIKGKGTFNLYGSRASLINSRKEGNIGSLSISEGANVIEKEAGSSFYNSQTKLTVSGASMRFADVPMDAVLNINVENSGYLYFDATRTLKADSIDVKKGSELYINKSTSGKALQMSMPATGVTGKITVGGTMSIKTLGDKLLYMKSDTAAASKDRFVLEEGASILVPENGTIDSLYNSNDGSDDIYVASELLIAPADFERVSITSATAVSGEPFIGNTITAGAVSPAGATVSYQWQYADTLKSEDAVWMDIPDATGKNYYLMQEVYTGKYLRVKITGGGKYTGTVYSTLASPIKTDGATMVDFIVDGCALGEYSRASTLWLKGDDNPDEVLMTVVAEDPSAQVEIKNVTEGFDTKTDEEKTINAASGMMPFKYNGSSTNNKIRITITSGENTKVYNVNVCKFEQDTKVYINSTTNSIIKIKDSLGNVVDSVSGDSFKYVTVEPGKKYTVEASTTREGWIVTNLGNEKYDKKSTLDGDIRSAEFTVSRGKMEKFYATDVMVKAPETRVSWGQDNCNGCYIFAEWDTPSPEVSADTGYTGKISAKLYDEDGKPVKVHEKDEFAPDGFFLYTDGIGHIFKVDDDGYQLSLDTTKSYTVQLWYDATDISQCEIQEVTLNPVDLAVSNQRVAIIRPAEGTVNKTVFIGDKARGFYVKSFPADSEEDFEARSSSEPGCVNICVSSTAKLGTRYVVIYEESDAGEIIGDVLTVDVIEASGEAKVRLGENKGTLDIYSSDNIVVPLSIIGSDAAVTAVTFVDSTNTALSDKYRFVTDGSREAVIEPQGLQPAENGNVDWDKVVKEYKGTFKAKLKVQLTDNSTVPATVKEYTTSEYYTLTVGGKAPVATAKAVKLNSFYSADNCEMEISSKSGDVVSAVVDATKTSAKTVACPDWVSVSEDGLVATLINNKLINKKGNGKIYLNVKVDGYRIPAKVAVTAAYTAPKVKLSDTIVTVPTEAARYVDGKTLLIMSADNKVSLESLNITGVRVANKADLLKLSDKEQKQYASSKYFMTDMFDEESGSFVLAKATNIRSNEFQAGKALLIATIAGNSAQELLIPLTIKTVNINKATLKMDKASITLNNYLDSKTDEEYGVHKMTATVIPSIDGISLDGLTFTVTDSKGKGDYSEYLDISKTLARGEYLFKTNSKTTEGSYKVNFYLPGIAKPATINVIVKGTVPTIKFGAKSVTIDRLLDYANGVTSWDVPIALSDDSIVRSAASFSYVVTDAKKNVVSDALYVSFRANGHEMTIYPMTKIANGSYSIEVTYTMASGQVAKAKFPVKVVGNAPVLKADKTAVSLNPDLGKQDCAVVTFTRPDYCNFIGYGAHLYDNKNREVLDAVDIDFNQEKGVLRLNPRANIVPGTNYKLVITQAIRAHGDNLQSSNVITVKALKGGNGKKAAITQKTAVKGSLDLSRPDSVMQVINSYNGWNSNVAAADGNPIVRWEVYAYDKKNKPYDCGESDWQLDGETGLVARGNSIGYTATGHDWFIDVDESSYGVTLKLNPENQAVKKLTAEEGFYDLNYKIVVKTTFDKYNSETENLVLVSEAKFKAVAGAVKLAAPSPNKVILNSMDRFDSKIVKIKLTDIDADSVDITEVSSVNNPYYDATLIRVGDGYAYVAIGWKNDIVDIGHKNGKINLEFYAGYNSIDRGKKNATAAVSVETR